MTRQAQIALNHSDQVDAFEEAEALVQDDFHAGVVDGDPWGGNLPAGEVVRILAAAYTGDLEVEPLEPDRGE